MIQYLFAVVLPSGAIQLLDLTEIVVGLSSKHLAMPCLSVQAFHQAVRIYHATRNHPGLLCHLPGHHAGGWLLSISGGL
jgi:hypothetical protein